MKKRIAFMCLVLMVISVATFCIPIVINISNRNIQYNGLIVFPLLVILVNMIPFVFFSETAKFACSNYSEFCKHKCIKLLIEDKKSILTVLSFSLITTILLSIGYTVIYSNFHIKALLLHNFCVLVTYVAGCFVFFYSAQNGFTYKKGDYFFFRSFLLISLPMCSAVYIVELLNKQLENVTLLVLLSIGAILYAVFTYKKVFDSKRKYTISILCTIVGLIILYFVFGTSNEVVLRNMINTMLFSLEFAVYSYLLTSLIYTNVSPKKTKKSKHSVEKLQVSLLNLAPVFSITLLIELMDQPMILVLYAAINIIATLLVGKNKGIFNTLIVVILLIGFVCLSVYTFSHRINYVLNLSSPITWISPIAAFLGFLKSFILNKDDDERQNTNQQLKRLDFLRPNMAYYTTAFISNLLLGVIATIIEVTPNAYSDNFSKSQVIIYIAVTTIIMISRGYLAYSNQKELAENNS